MSTIARLSVAATLVLAVSLLPTTVFAGDILPPPDINPVPEPTSLLVWLGVLSAGALGRRPRR